MAMTELVCDLCGKPEGERGNVLVHTAHGAVLACRVFCDEFHGPTQRHYADLTPEVLDRLENEADDERWGKLTVSVPSSELHALVRAARWVARFDAGSIEALSEALRCEPVPATIAEARIVLHRLARAARHAAHDGGE